MKMISPRAAPVILAVILAALPVFTAGCKDNDTASKTSVDHKITIPNMPGSDAETPSETESVISESGKESSRPNSSASRTSSPTASSAPASTNASTAPASSVAPREMVKINFPEGYTVYQMAEKLQSAGICNRDTFIQTINGHSYSYPIINSLPNYDKRWYKTEGYFYAATYEFYKDSTPLEIAEKMIKGTINNVQGKYSYAGMTLDQIITLASVIEKEGKTLTDMRRISAVFHKRLKGGKLGLQSDVTVNYIERYVNKKLAPNGTDYSAYNTYKTKTLPVGPICSPGKNALSAAVNPDPDYANMEYFFADSKGVFYFSVTYAEHQQKMKDAGVTEQTNQ